MNKYGVAFCYNLNEVQVRICDGAKTVVAYVTPKENQQSKAF